MSVLGSFHFIRPLWLLLAPLAILIWWQLNRAQDPLRGWRAVIDGPLLNSLTVGDDSSRKFQTATVLVAWLVGIVAVAGPTWKPEPSPFADDPVPVVMVLKAGESMDLADLPPSRMERARLKITDFSQERIGQPLGLIAYAATPHLVLPPTRDTSVVATMASEISPAIMPKAGDNLFAALALAAKTLGDSGGSVVVVADSVPQANQADLDAINQASIAIHFHAIAHDNSPEFEQIKQVATKLGADVTLITPDIADVRALVRATAKAPVKVTEAAGGTRWSESGWWLVPVLALLALNDFRRVDRTEAEERER